MDFKDTLRARHKRFLPNKRGSMTLFAGMLLLVAILVSGGVVDYVSLTMQERDVQNAADRAALGAARELLVGGRTDGRMQEVATAIAETNLANYAEVKVSAQLRQQDGGVEVEVSAKPRVFFPGPIGSNAKRPTATAIADAVGAPVCMIGLDTKVKHTLLMDTRAAITARGCAIYSNSLAMDGVSIEDHAQVDAGFICSAGGVETAKDQSINPKPLTDCPAFDDPLSERPPPSFGKCDFSKLKIKKAKTATLKPGVYCDGLEIDGVEVTLEPGVYVIKDGSLEVGGDGSLLGEGVGFFLTGKDALIDFDKDSTIRLTAPLDGPLAGLLFYEDRKVKPADDGKAKLNYSTMGKANEHRIKSNDAAVLVGTIYISRNRLLIAGENPIAQKSAYTIIVAREFTLKEGPEMVLNTDYNGSPVPVPMGVGNRATQNQGTRLVQ